MLAQLNGKVKLTFSSTFIVDVSFTENKVLLWQISRRRLWFANIILLQEDIVCLAEEHLRTLPESVPVGVRCLVCCLHYWGVVLFKKLQLL